jgi:hypothetical protein
MVLDFWRGGLNEMSGNNPFLECRVLGYDLCLQNLQQEYLIETIAAALNEGFYVMLFLDEALLPFSTEYGTGNAFAHHVLIHNLSFANRTVGVLGFKKIQTHQEYGRLSTNMVSFDDLVCAVAAIRYRINSGQVADQYTYLLRYRPYDSAAFFFEREFGVDIVRRSLEQYLSERDDNTSNPVDPARYSFGAGVYEAAAEYFLSVSEGNISPQHRRDVRHLHVLEEHNSLMIRRIDKLKEYYPNARDAFDGVRSDLRSVVQGLQVLKIMLMMRIGWQEDGDLRPVARKLGELGRTNRSVLQRLHNLL